MQRGQLQTHQHKQASHIVPAQCRVKKSAEGHGWGNHDRPYTQGYYYSQWLLACQACQRQ
jgi:hypothetical protein